MYNPFKQLVFVLIAGAIIGVHRNRHIPASHARLPEIELFMLRGQLISAEFRDDLFAYKMHTDSKIVHT